MPNCDTGAGFVDSAVRFGPYASDPDGQDAWSFHDKMWRG
jgi:hypothetical protein